MAKISFNGQEYDSVEAMPANVRQLYEMAAAMFADTNQDGVPDLFAGMTGSAAPTLLQTTQFIVDGKAYSSIDQLPADARQKYEQALGKFDANRNGIPDMLEGGPFTVPQPPSPSAPPASPPAAQPPLVTVIGESQPISRLTLMVGAGVVVLLLVAVAVYVLGNV